MHEIDGGYQIACLSVHRETHELGVALFMPYLWVNTGTAMATGREVLGFQKDVAISFSADDAAVTSAAMQGVLSACVDGARHGEKYPARAARLRTARQRRRLREPSDRRFDLLRQAYDNLDRSEEWALRTWQDALAPRRCCTLEDRPWPGFGGWADLPMHLPDNGRVPGERARHADASQGRPELLDGILGFVESLLHMATRIPLRPLEAVGVALDLGVLGQALGDLRERGAAWVQDAGRFVTPLQQELHAQLQPLHQRLGVHSQPAIDTGGWPFVSELAALEMGLRFVVGLGALLEQGQGFESLDDLEFSDWLDQTLAFPMLPWTRSSAFVRACYVLPFAYAEGNTRRPLLAAGPGARAHSGGLRRSRRLRLSQPSSG